MRTSHPRGAGIASSESRVRYNYCMDVLHTCLAITHAMASAAWFGAMFYSLNVLRPRGLAYFGSAATFEPFITSVSANARYPVLTAFFIVGVTGVLLLPGGPWTQAYAIGIAIKAVLYLAALMVFIYVSWRLWPMRVFATDAEVPANQRHAKRVAWVMLLLVGVNFAVGVML